MGNLPLYLAIYALPMVLLLARSAPDLEIWPLRFVGANRLPAQAVMVGVWLSLANLIISKFLSLTIEPQQVVVMVGWECAYLVFARVVGPWLHDDSG